MRRNTSIALESYFESSIESTVPKGHFRNANEFVGTERKALEEENRIIVLRNAIQEGIDSGRAENFDSKKHLERLKSG